MSVESVTLPIAGAQLSGDLAVPDEAAGLVLFVRGGGGSGCSPRNRAVAAQLNGRGFGTLLL
ncbi:hydrolase, partial [Streptomyces sp. NPDC004134]